MKPAGRVVKNSLVLILARITSSFLSMLLGVYAARRLGEVGYGQYSFIMVVVVGYFLVVSEFGMHDLLVKDIARRKDFVNQYLSTSIVFKIFASLGSILCIYLLTIALDKREILAPIFVASLSLMPRTTYSSFDAVFRAFQEMEYPALTDIVYSIVRTSIGITLLILGYDLTRLLFGLLLTDAFKVLVILLFYRKRHLGMEWAFRKNVLKYLVKQSYVILIWIVLGTIRARSDILFLSIFKGDAQVGWYSAALNVVSPITMVSVIVMNTLLPVMSQIHISLKHEQLEYLCRIAFKYILITLIPVALVVMIFAEPIVNLLYRHAYQQSAIILQFLVWTGISTTILALLTVIVLAIDQYKWAAKLAVFNTSIRIALNFLLVPRYGYLGACIAAISEDIFTVFMFTALISKRFRIGLVGPGTYKLLLTSLFITAIGFLLQTYTDTNQALMLLSGALFYVTMLARLNIVSKNDLSYVRRVL